MSLDITLYATIETEVYQGNITHNLGKMADEAGIYRALWRPEELFPNPSAKDLMPILKEGLKNLKSDPDYYKQFNPENGWGDYNGLVRFVTDYLNELESYPDARISACR